MFGVECVHARWLSGVRGAVETAGSCVTLVRATDISNVSLNFAFSSKSLTRSDTIRAVDIDQCNYPQASSS